MVSLKISFEYDKNLALIDASVDYSDSFGFASFLCYLLVPFLSCICILVIAIISLTSLKATEGMGLSVTLRMQGCVDGPISPPVQSINGRDVREGTQCPTVGHHLTTPLAQLWVKYFSDVCLCVWSHYVGSSL